MTTTDYPQLRHLLRRWQSEDPRYALLSVSETITNQAALAAELCSLLKTVAEPDATPEPVSPVPALTRLRGLLKWADLGLDDPDAIISDIRRAEAAMATVPVSEPDEDGVVARWGSFNIRRLAAGYVELRCGTERVTFFGPEFDTSFLSLVNTAIQLADQMGES